MPLTRTENKWTIGQIKDKDIARLQKVRGILNKLTPEKFEALLLQLESVGIDKPDILVGIIGLIFENAVAQPTFCNMYAELCLRLAKMLPEFPSEDGQKPLTFRRLLLNRCQEAFEQAFEKVTYDDEIPQLEKDEADMKRKRRTLGNIRLICELYKKRLLIERIIHECIAMLGQADIPSEENCEALCLLFATVGSELDELDRVRQTTRMNAYFGRLKALCENSLLNSRLRFMFRDVIDLRENKWVPRRQEETAKPIQKLHDEAAAMGIRVPHPRNVHDNSGPQRPFSHENEGDWETAGARRGGKPQGRSQMQRVHMAGPSGAQQGYSALVGGPPGGPPARRLAIGQVDLNRNMTPTSARNRMEQPKIQSGRILSEKEVKQMTRSFCLEYLANPSLEESKLAYKEFTGNIVDFAREFISCMNDQSVAEHAKLTELLFKLGEEKLLSPVDFTTALGHHFTEMEDTIVDVPLLPKLLALALKPWLCNGFLAIATIRDLTDKITTECGVSARRDFIAAIILHICDGRADIFEEMKKTNISALLQPVDESDSTLEAFLASKNLPAL